MSCTLGRGMANNSGTCRYTPEKRKKYNIYSFSFQANNWIEKKENWIKKMKIYQIHFTIKKQKKNNFSNKNTKINTIKDHRNRVNSCLIKQLVVIWRHYHRSVLKIKTSSTKSLLYSHFIMFTGQKCEVWWVLQTVKSNHIFTTVSSSFYFKIPHKSQNLKF